MQARRDYVWEWCALAAYAALVIYAASHHVPWSDETHFWVLARDTRLGTMLLHRLHYEGQPALWPGMLWLMAHLHMPFAAMHWLSAACAIAGAAVWLWKTPLPRWLRLLFPFTFFIAFQYAVVERSYVLYPLLTFAACALIVEKEKQRPVLLAVVLGLLANLCMFGTVEAAALGLVAAAYWRRDGLWRTQTARCVTAAGVLFAAGTLAALTAWPARDVAFTTGIMDLPSVRHAMHREPAAGAEEAAAASSETDTAAAEDTPAEIAAAAAHRGNGLGDIMWRAMHPPAGTKAKHVFLKQRLLFAASLLVFPLATHTWLALAAIVLLLWRCLEQRRLVELLPWVFVYGISVLIYAAEHHTGLILVSFFAVLWLTCPEAMPKSGLPRVREVTLHGVLFAILVLQVGWTIHALASERRGPYSGDREAAEYLKAHAAPGAKIAGFYVSSDGMDGYFPGPIFFNQPSTYWRYSKDPRVMGMPAEEVLAARPEFVVMATTEYQQQMIFNQLVPVFDPASGEPGDGDHVEPLFVRSGYRETHRFCGLAPMRSGYSLKLCQTVLER